MLFHHRMHWCEDLLEDGSYVKPAQDIGNDEGVRFAVIGLLPRGHRNWVPSIGSHRCQSFPSFDGAAECPAGPSATWASTKSAEPR